MENKARSKFAAATRFERKGQTARAAFLRNQAEKIRERYIEFALKG